MSYEYVDVKNRVVEHPKRIELTDVATGQVLGTFDYSKIPGIISELGTAQNKAFLQPIVDSLYDLYGDLVPIQVQLTPDSSIKSTQETKFNTPCNAIIKGKTLVNLVDKNVDDLTKWSVFGGTATVVGDVLRITGDGSNLQIGINYTLPNYVANTKRFGYGKARTTTADSNEIECSVVSGGVFRHFINEVNPTINEWFEGGVIADEPINSSISNLITYRLIFADSATANGKVLEIDIPRGTFVIEDGDKTLDEYIGYTKNGYFSGVQHTRGVSVKSVNKNFFDKFSTVDGFALGGGGIGNDDTFSTIDILIESGKQYSIVNFLSANTFWSDKKLGSNLGLFSSTGGLAPTNSKYLRVTVSKTQIDTTQLEEGTTSTDYVSNKNSQVVYPDLLGSVPNGTADEIDTKNGVKIAGTNVLKDGHDYKLKSSDIILLEVSSSTNYDIVQIDRNGLHGIFAQNAGITANKHIIQGFSRNLLYTGASLADDINYVGTYIDSLSLSTRIYLFVEKGRFTDIEEAKKSLQNGGLVGTSLTYELASPETSKLDTVGQVNAYADYTQFTSEVGVIPNELATLHLDGTVYVTNDSRFNDTYFEFRAKDIEKVIYNGENIISLGNKLSDFGNGNYRWTILQSVVEDNNIDINKIYVYYTTSETSPGFEVEINASNSLAQSHDDLTQTVADTSAKIDVNTKTLNEAIGVLGAKIVTGFSVTPYGLCTWNNPETSDFVRTEIYQSEFDINHYTYEQLNNINGIQKYNPGTNESITTSIDVNTKYYYVAVSIYGVGGIEYKSITNAFEITSPNDFLFYENGTENVAWTITDRQSTYFPISVTPYKQAVTETVDVSAYSVIRVTCQSFGGTLPNILTLSFGASSVNGGSGTIELDVSSETTGQITILPNSGDGELRVTEVRGVV